MLGVATIILSKLNFTSMVQRLILIECLNWLSILPLVFGRGALMSGANWSSSNQSPMFAPCLTAAESSTLFTSCKTNFFCPPPGSEQVMFSGFIQVFFREHLHFIPFSTRWRRVELWQTSRGDKGVRTK